MDVTIKRLPELQLWGKSIITSPFSDEITHLWSRLMPLMEKYYDFDVTYAVEKMIPGAMHGEFTYYAGFPRPEGVETPQELEAMTVPPAEYAVYKIVGSLEGLPELIREFYEDWLPNSEYKPGGDYEMEVYDEDFAAFAPDSIMYIYVPVVKKSA